MGRKQWILAGKIGGALVLAALAIWAVWSMSAYQTGSALLSEQHAERAQRSADEIDSACSGLAGPPLVDCVTRQIEGSRNDQRAEYDLSAQERMATWAFWMFAATTATVLIGLVGLYMIWRTLEFTGQAAAHTKDMLAEARKASRAAEGAVRATQEAALMQSRAWLDIDISTIGDPVYDGDQLTVRVCVSAKNHGKSPAIGVDLFIRPITDGDDEVALLKALYRDDTGFLAAPILFPQGVSLPLKETVSFPADDTSDLRILVYARYALPGGGKRRHFTEFIYTYAWLRPDGSPGPLREAPEGVQVDTVIFRSGGGMNA